MQTEPRRVFTAWHLHSPKKMASYVIFLGETGLVIRCWGPGRAPGPTHFQVAAREFSSFIDAQDFAMKDLYGKRSKGYRVFDTPVVLRFTMKSSLVNRLTTVSHQAPGESLVPLGLRRELFAAWNEGKYDPAAGLRNAVLTHYTAFLDRIYTLMEDVNVGRNPTSALTYVTTLDDAWRDIEDAHSLAKSALDTARQMIASRALGSSTA